MVFLCFRFSFLALCSHNNSKRSENSFRREDFDSKDELVKFIDVIKFDKDKVSVVD